MYHPLYVPPSRPPYATPYYLRRPLRRRLILISMCIAVVFGAWKFGGLVGNAHASNTAAITDPGLAGEAREAARTQWREDRVRRKRIGKASFYAASFFGRTMADGTPMRPRGDNAASRTLPLGTTALVTNLETGKTAIVTIRDRGPYVDGRIVDLSPATAQKIGITPKKGVARVEVAPLEVPMPDGSIKPGMSDDEARDQDQRLARIARVEPGTESARLNP